MTIYQAAIFMRAITPDDKGVKLTAEEWYRLKDNPRFRRMHLQRQKKG